MLRAGCRCTWRRSSRRLGVMIRENVSKVSKPTCRSAFSGVSSPCSARCHASTKRRPISSRVSPMCTCSSSLLFFFLIDLSPRCPDRRLEVLNQPLGHLEAVTAFDAPDMLVVPFAALLVEQHDD